VYLLKQKDHLSIIFDKILVNYGSGVIIMEYLLDWGYSVDLYTLPDKVYHGTITSHKTSLVKGIDIGRCKKNTDFGQGFYTTFNQQQAIDFATSCSYFNNKYQKNRMSNIPDWQPSFSNPLILTYAVDKNVLATLNGLLFDCCDKIWAEFIYNNRLGIDFLHSAYHNLDTRFDYVYGCMADAEIATAIADAKQKNITYDEFCCLIEPYDKFSQNQLSFHTLQSLSCLRLIDEQIIRKDG
jgi:hypothetical protein